MALTHVRLESYIRNRGCNLKDIQRVLQKKRAQYAQLAKEIELLQQAELTLREIAPLLEDGEDDDDSAILTEEVDEGTRQPQAMAASASASSSSPQEPFSTPVRGTVPRWP
jgi:DNA-binding transcriptional MerR regulator